MKRTLTILAVLMLLAVPMMAGADDQGWMPPEWTPTPPAQQMVDVGQLASLLVEKGMISRQEYAQLTHPPVIDASSARTKQGVELERNR
jgi:hypothetical protein